MRKTIILCHARKLEILTDDYESVHGVGTFVGSPEWQATLSRDWHDGECLQPADHINDHVFTDDARPSRRERKAS